MTTLQQTTRPTTTPAQSHADLTEPRVAIVIVNHGTPELTIDCLHSLTGELVDLPGLEVFVTDNTCDQQSAETVITAVCKNGWFDRVSVIPLEDNAGFPHGNNAVIRPALQQDNPPDYFILLNPDTIVQPGAIVELVAFMQINSRVGIAGSRLIDTDGRPQCSAHQQPSPLSELNAGAQLGLLAKWLRGYVVSPPIRHSAHRCDWVSGAAMIIRRDVFETIGLIDEHYFLYFDEPDFCRRAERAGFEVWHVPSSRIMHLEGKATGISNRHVARNAYWFSSRRRFFVKSYGITGLIGADLLWLIGYVSLVARRCLHLGGNNTDEPAHYVRDLILGDLKALLAGQLKTIRH